MAEDTRHASSAPGAENGSATEEATGAAFCPMYPAAGRSCPQVPILLRETVPLSQLQPGDTAQIVSLAPGKLRERLMELGLTAGAQVELIRFAPMGDPIDVKVRGYRLSLRLREAAAVKVHPGACSQNCPVEAGVCLDPACPRSEPTPAAATSRTPITYAMIGNPNSGKTTLFNALTGLRQKVGNYPGVTVEKKEGRLEAHGRKIGLLDLPGLYSLSPQSPDEAIARDVLMGRRADTPRPHAIVNVIDANNLERNLLLTSQLMDLGLPMVVVLTMTDVARGNGVQVDPVRLERALGLPVRSVVVRKRHGVDGLMKTLSGSGLACPAERPWKLPQVAEAAVAAVQELVCKHCNLHAGAAFSETMLFLQRGPEAMPADCPEPVRQAVARHTEEMRREGIDFAQAATEARYAWVSAVTSTAVQNARAAVTWSDRVDRVLMHKVWGYVVFAALMAFVFQTIFSWAQYPMDLIGHLVDGASRFVGVHMPPGDLHDLLIDGVLGGVGTMLTFLPQILLLFFFIGLLEDTGYMARAAFMMDRLMSRVGLHGKSFIPLMSSFACAIPGIMATRTIDNRRARLVTILVAPLMSCSARLPVYTLMIAATIPRTRVLGLFSLPGLTLLSMYLLGTAAAFTMAWVFRRTVLKGEANLFLMELPPYRMPQLRTVAMQMVERTGLFVRKAGTVILAMSVVLWFLSSYPKPADASMGKTQRVEQSFAGRTGKMIEPLIRPLGFDWRIGISLISSFAAREVFVSSMATIYNAQDGHDSAVTLQSKMKDDVDPATGRHTFTPLLGLAVMVYYVLAMQCISTIAVVRRETNGWKWPLFQIAYMTVLAWVVTFAVYQGGKALGFG
ncbi:MAG TPA: ferrous iron transport protein B [Armatimonadota bacterium]|jgi:ferrous iron transport protein B